MQMRILVHKLWNQLSKHYKVGLRFFIFIQYQWTQIFKSILASNINKLLSSCMHHVSHSHDLYIVVVSTLCSHIILDGIEKSPSKQVVVDYIVANDVAIVPLLTRYSFQKHNASMVDDFPNKKKPPVNNLLNFMIKGVVPPNFESWILGYSNILCVAYWHLTKVLMCLS